MHDIVSRPNILPQSTAINIYQLHKICRLAEFEALNFGIHGRVGAAAMGYFLYYAHIFYGVKSNAYFLLVWLYRLPRKLYDSCETWPDRLTWILRL